MSLSSREPCFKNDFKKNLKFKLKFIKILKSKFKFLPKMISNYFLFWFLICVRNSSEFIEKWLFYKDFRFFHLLSYRVRCTINRSHSTPCKIGRIRASANFSRTLLGLFSVCEWQDLSFTYQKSEKTTHLDNLVFSAFSVLWGTVKKSGWNPTRVRSYLGSAPGSLWQNSPHKDAFSASAWQT